MIWQGPLIAVDWGTSNRRAWRIAAGGAVEAAFEDDRGIMAMPEGGFGAEVAALRERLGDLPMLLGGMIGSNRGWRETAYVPCPADALSIAAAIVWVDPRTGIVPGVSQQGRAAPDVMRGEEVQIVGALASGLSPADGLLCLPGTHAKWVRVQGGKIVAFSTWMTGEIFSLLRHHSILAPQLAGKVRRGPDFAAGVAASERGDALARLFAVRAAHLLDEPMSDASAYVSGLLIGAEVRAGLAQAQGVMPLLIGRPDLCSLYAAAITQVSGDPGEAGRVIDGSAAFRAGICALSRELS